MSDTLVHLISYRDWMIAVTQKAGSRYFCWVITPEAIALNDGEIYDSESEAMMSGRSLVRQSVD